MFVFVASDMCWCHPCIISASDVFMGVRIRMWIVVLYGAVWLLVRHCSSFVRNYSIIIYYENYYKYLSGVCLANVLYLLCSTSVHNHRVWIWRLHIHNYNIRITLLLRNLMHFAKSVYARDKSAP